MSSLNYPSKDIEDVRRQWVGKIFPLIKNGKVTRTMVAILSIETIFPIARIGWEMDNIGMIAILDNGWRVPLETSHESGLQIMEAEDMEAHIAIYDAARAGMVEGLRLLVDM